MKRAFLDRALAASREGRPAALATDLKTGKQAFAEGERVEGELAVDEATMKAIRLALSDDRNGTIEAPGGSVFVEVFNPPLRLVVVGAVHIAQPLARMAALAGYGVTVIDPRSAFATDERFPGVTLSTDWPDEALPRLNPDRRTAIVTLTHDPKIDDPALAAALKSSAFYIGALGSRKTHAARTHRLQKAGFADAEIARIHGPVGLAIGAVSPAEIAVSVLAEITQVLHAEHLKDRAAA